MFLAGNKRLKRYRDAYITADYAKAIQEERRKLIKAMFKAKEQGLQAKRVGRFPDGIWTHERMTCLLRKQGADCKKLQRIEC